MLDWVSTGMQKSEEFNSVFFNPFGHFAFKFNSLFQMEKLMAIGNNLLLLRLWIEGYLCGPDTHDKSSLSIAFHDIPMSY